MSDEALYEVTVSRIGPPQAAASPYLPPTPRREAVAQFTAPAGEAAAMMRTLADGIAPLPAGVASCPLCSRTDTHNHGGWYPDPDRRRWLTRERPEPTPQEIAEELGALWARVSETTRITDAELRRWDELCRATERQFDPNPTVRSGDPDAYRKYAERLDAEVPAWWRTASDRMPPELVAEAKRRRDEERDSVVR